MKGGIEQEGLEDIGEKEKTWTNLTIIHYNHLFPPYLSVCPAEAASKYSKRCDITNKSKRSYVPRDFPKLYTIFERYFCGSCTLKLFWKNSPRSKRSVWGWVAARAVQHRLPSPIKNFLRRYKTNQNRWMHFWVNVFTEKNLDDFGVPQEVELDFDVRHGRV